MRWGIATAVMMCAVFVALAQDTIKVSVETVQVYTNVTDLKGRFVTGMKRDNFKVFEDGKEQTVDAFTNDDTPLSIGILFDVNGIMGDNSGLARQGALQFLRAGNLGNEYFAAEYNDKPQLTIDFTRDIAVLEKLPNPILRSGKETSMLDAAEFGLEKLRSAHNPRKVLLMFAGGGIMKNQHKMSQVRELARRLDIQVLGVTITPAAPAAAPDGFSPTPIQSMLGSNYEPGLEVMHSLDGDGFASDSAPDFLQVCRRIAVGLRNQYILGYQSTNPVHDGKYRHLDVKVKVEGVADLIVHMRAGYYAIGSEGGVQ